MVLDVETLAKAPSAIEFSASGVVTALKPMTVFPGSISKLGMLRVEIPDNWEPSPMNDVAVTIPENEALVADTRPERISRPSPDTLFETNEYGTD